jgi:hypothetical protein
MITGINWALLLFAFCSQHAPAHSSDELRDCFYKYTGSKGLPPVINLPSESEIIFPSSLKLTFNVSSDHGNQQPIPLGIAAALLIDKRHDILLWRIAE